MCGIFGYLWHKRASGEVIRGLQRLEYRGYDSAGICLLNDKKHIKLLKSTGKVQELKNIIETINLESYNIWIWHTRWATHGKVTEKNCHPHVSDDKRFYVVHNGIIENYSLLRDILEKKGMKFYSETDTEVAVNMFQNVYNGDTMDSMKKLVSHLEGAYALVFIDKEDPNLLFGAKLGSPLVLGISGNSFYVSSDYRSLSGLADEYIALEDGDIFIIKDGEYIIQNNGVTVVRDKENIPAEEVSAELGDFKHYMIKEIFEQPKVFDNAFAGRIDFENQTLKSNALEDISKKGFKRIHIIASGTSYHAGLLGRQYFEDFANLETEVTIATEFKYRKKFIHSDTLYLFISQSGETADVLESLKIVKAKWGYTFGIVNVPGSSIARLSDSGLFTHAGIEVGVASTKAFIWQISVLVFMALYFGKIHGLDAERFSELIEELSVLKGKISMILGQTEHIRKVAYKYSHYKNFFFLGRLYELPVAMEWSLKLKEITYLHSEAYSSGELKHGPIALIDESFPTIIINGNGPLHAKNMSSVEEICSRSGKVIGIIANTDTNIGIYNDTIPFEPSLPEFNPFLETVILQIFAYCVADHLGRDVDKPRNLAKSVTVE